MTLLSIFIFLSIAGLSACAQLSDVNQKCANTYNQTLDNDFLLGTWYYVYKWAHYLNLPASSACGKLQITKPTAQELDKYRAKYQGDLPYSFDDNPVLHDKDNGYWKGLLTGKTEAKFYVLDPKSHMVIYDEGYKVDAYMRIDDKYVAYIECALRGNILWLLSRKSNPTTAELDQVISRIEEVKGKERQRYCA